LAQAAGEVPPDRRPGRTPVTTLFPSGHAAAAAAFATGVGKETPALAAPVGAHAAAVGMSRVVNGVHDPSDIARDGRPAWASGC
jgi:membrane-associated phospholipid phosphatase